MSTRIPERNIGGNVDGCVSDNCCEKICESAIGNIWELLEEKLRGVTASRVVFDSLHEILD